MVTAEQRETFRRDGVVCLRGVFDRGWVERLRGAAEACMAAPSPLAHELAKHRGDKGRFFHDHFVWTYNEDARAFVFGSPAARIARELMGGDGICIFFDQWLIKEAGTPTRTPWHHDLPYWPVEGAQVCTLWLALDHVDGESGAVEYVKGSHLWGERYQPEAFVGDGRYQSRLPPVPDIEAKRDELEFIQFELEPGDCTVHHALLVHGAPGNGSLTRRRRAYVTRWAGDDAVYAPRPGIMPMLRDPGLAPGAPIECGLWPRVL